MVTNMKKYQKVKLVAKNQVVGSYAAGCPSKNRGNDGSCTLFLEGNRQGCMSCERTM